MKDKHSIHASLESLDVRTTSKESPSTLEEEDSLITSPLLLPTDYKSTGYNDVDYEDDASIYCLMNMESANTITIPRSSNYQGLQRSSPSRAEMYFDHIAENNYKIWLSQKQ